MPATGSDLADSSAQQADLGNLAAELRARGYHTRLGADPGRGAYVHVRNPRAEIMTERIYVRGQFFTWPWDEPVARRDQAATAAALVARVLRALGQPAP